MQSSSVKARKSEQTESSRPNTALYRYRKLYTDRIISLSLTHTHTLMHLVFFLTNTRTHISLPHLGEMSHPCCINAPSENHRELKMPNSLGGWSVGPSSVVPSSGSSACHSYGLKRLTWDSEGKMRVTDHLTRSNKEKEWRFYNTINEKEFKLLFKYRVKQMSLRKPLRVHFLRLLEERKGLLEYTDTLVSDKYSWNDLSYISLHALNISQCLHTLH